MEKYYLKTSKVENKPGQWNSVLCEIYNSKDEKLGEYLRHYYSFAFSTFFPFSSNGKDYALYSADYNTISVMNLPNCTPVELKPECIEQLNHFCPVEVYVPRFEDHDKYRSQIHSSDEKYEEGYSGFSTLAFVTGCVWGDDSSWKLNLLDLSNIENGELWYVDNSLNKKWLYVDTPISPDKFHCFFEKDSNFPYAYDQVIEEHQNFRHNILNELEINEHDSVISIVNIEDIPRETEGVVVHVYHSSKVFAVEFFENKKSLGVFTVKGHQLKKLNTSNENK